MVTDMQKAMWSRKEHQVFVKDEGAHSFRERGILCYVQIAGTAFPVMGVTSPGGVRFRVLPTMTHEDWVAGRLDFESEDGDVFRGITQRLAVSLVGPDANFVFNPWVAYRETPSADDAGDWVRLFPERQDY